MLNELGIYIHIPFCKQKCYYCDFVSYSNKCSEVKEYIESLKKEIEEFDFSNYKVTSIYIGGGTPSYIDSIYIVEILSELKEKLKCNLIEFKDIEITIEVNPGTVDTKKLNDYKKLGINRLSIGLQSTKNDILKKIGRIHTYQEFLKIYKLARETGFKNINIDLMIGIPGQKIGDLKNTLQDIIKLEPEHISVYSLIIEENTPIEKMLENGEIKLPDEDLERNMYWYVKNTLELNGYNHYEISNFAKLGKESRHNLNCWNQEEYIGFGVAAHSYLNGIRFSNTINVEEYIQHIENNRKEENIQIEESQSLEDKKNEFMMLGFRKIQGVDIARFKEKFIDNPIFLYRENLNKLVEEGLIEVDLNHIKLTNKGIDLANLVFEEFVDDC
ncbi:oxygen-independent coproporphyrinogen III oxidase [Clostridium sp. CAG:343]|jgi:oxygen-independent coproporphyrinogen-3 oxidase|nr:oxygen-independent coproporphyrinogen III oxidase [Clostridium sp. CAG:343]